MNLPPPKGPPVLKMRWEDLLFLHWAWDSSEIQNSLPEGLTVDTFQGSAWLAVVPFSMRRVHPNGLFPVPGLSDFFELNVRTYVRGPGGLPGVWFYSLACNQPVAVAFARTLFGLNYVNAKISVTKGTPLEYHCRRGDAPSSRFVYSVAGVGIGQRAPVDSLEEFLLERYLLYSAKSGGRLYAGRVVHQPYLITPGNVSDWSFGPAASDGFADPGRPPDHIVTAEAVDVSAWPIRRTMP